MFLNGNETIAGWIEGQNVNLFKNYCVENRMWTITNRISKEKDNKMKCFDELNSDQNM